ncbi:hypothetical protein EIN_021460 [Entamoeba invadens IP1]|uniref:hypothetical protein n=1 Tax=Entamoeba invadens IP1 TaxID=370355 RepID=UPI0002C3D213|nr:hypothetical protein EIN_021460 [Entamoeba invadens IP1]ELP90617.1 hypothetical protein EIN_021460 [Entamoeba invadens IP1]|eukprot:XP_004257388.1 hypothetical protein EIN_021460 [Entamoeba invadens IP1]
MSEKEIEDPSEYAVAEMTNPLSKDIEAHIDAVTKLYTSMVSLNQIPVILVIGQSGVGKSSLINTIFKETVAAEGETSETTENFKKYTSSKITIYDSKGISPIDTQNFANSLNKFLDVQTEKKRVHIVWFVLNSVSGRLQPFEEEICNTILMDVPVCFVLNKSDLSTEESRMQLNESITKLHSKLCLGVFETVSATRNALVKIDKCTKCHADELVLYNKTKTIQCCKCMNVMNAGSQDESLVKKTLENIPQMTQRFFISVQKASFSIKDEAAQKELFLLEKELKDVPLDKAVLSVMNRMVNIAILFECRKSSDIGQTKKFLLTILSKNKSVTDKLIQMITGNEEEEKTHAFAIAVEWYRVLKVLCWSSIQNSINEEITLEKAEKIVKEVLGLLVSGDLEDMAIKLSNFGLGETLKDCTEIDLKSLGVQNTPRVSTEQQSDIKETSPQPKTA